MPARLALFITSCVVLAHSALSGCGEAEPVSDASSTGAQTGGNFGSGAKPGSGGAPAPGSGSSPATSGGEGGSGSTGSGGVNSTGGSAGSDTGGAPTVDATCSAGAQDGTPQVLTLSGNKFAHDPTMIKVDDTYYRFWTGPHIPAATSTNLTHWNNAPTVYDGSYSSWTSTWLSKTPGNTFNFPWAPDVSAFGERIHIYSSFSAKFGDNISCITHLSTSDITSGDWTDHGPVICTEGNESYNAIDADVGLDVDGTPYLAFGSFWDGIEAFELNPDGSRKGASLRRLAWAPQIEAPVLFYRCGYYYLFVTWGLCCPGEGRSVDDLTYRVVAGRSENILGPYVDRNGKTMLSGGGTLIVEGDGVQWAAAGHSDVLFDGDAAYHLYHAYAESNGAASLRIAELMFDAEGWPVPHAP